VTGTGTTNYLPKWTSGSALGNSIIFNNSTSVGIGLTNPQSQLQINGDLTFSESGFDTVRLHQIAHGHSDGNSANNNLRFLVSDGAGTTAERMRLNGLGNLLIGTTTDAGFKLDVNGTGRFVSANNTTALSVTVGSNAFYEFKGNSSSGYSTTFNINDTGLFIGHNSSSRSLILQTNSTDRLTIAGTGAATFSSSVSASSFSVGEVIITSNQIYRNSGNEFYVNYSGAGNTMLGNGTGNVSINAGTNPSFRLHVGGTLGVTGAATFSSSVTANAGFEIPNGQFYRARRSSGSLLTDMIGIPSGTDDVRILTTGDFNILNGSLTNILAVKNGGNVGMGTNSPGARLVLATNLASSASFNWLTFRNLAGGYGTWGFAKQGLNRLSLNYATDSDTPNVGTAISFAYGGNVLIGTTTDSGNKLSVVGTIRSTQLRASEAGIGAGNYNIFSNDDNVGYIDTVRAVNSGDFQFRFTGTTRVTISTTGNVTATAFFESSDMRLKKLIDGSPQIAGIENLQAKLYEKEGKLEFGYFAQDAEKLMPYAVTKNADGFLNLSYREVHTAKIARLEQRVAELEKQLNLN